MKRALLAIVSTVTGLVLLLSFKSHSPSAATTPPAAVSSTTSGSGTASSGSGSRTYTGTSADTRYGPVQVRITVTNGTLSNVTAIEYPTESPRDAQINAYAVPVLDSEALAAHSAQIDMVSGATYTSEGYLQSLQSALDRAGL